MKKETNKWLLLVSFSIIFAWIISFPYEGPVMYALAGKHGLNGVRLNTLTVFSHFLGLFCGRFINKRVEQSKANVVGSVMLMLFISLFIPIVSVDLWVIMIPFLAFIAGLPISSYARLIQTLVAVGDRTRFGANVLIIGNIILVIAHVLAINARPIIGYIFVELMLLMAFLMIMRVTISQDVRVIPLVKVKEKVALTKYWIFFVFIFVISINSGIMFQVIYPFFRDFPMLTSIYTNVPYILAIYTLAQLMKVHKLNVLYSGLALWGVTFMLFAFAEASPLYFILICTVMLIACGIFDFFWWSIMANNFENVDNPSSLLGLGLSLNVLGVWFGGVLGNGLRLIGMDNGNLSYVGIGVIFISMLIILPLNNRLSALLEANDFVIKMASVSDHKKSSFLNQAKEVLTDREYEVFTLLIEGKKDREICEQLHISQNTTKTHNRNIYKKLYVSSRMELVENSEQDKKSLSS